MKTKISRFILVTFAVLFLLTGCTKKSTEKQILSFEFISLEIEATIDEEAKTITATVPFNTNLVGLTPSIVISEKATIIPSSDIAVDFTDPVPYTVTAEDGTQVVYWVTVTRTSILGLWGVEKIEYWQTDYDGIMIPSTFYSLDFIPGDLDNGIDLSFRLDLTGEMCDRSHPDTTIVKPHTYSFDYMNSRLNLHRTNESFVMDVLELTSESFVYKCEYDSGLFEKAYLKRLTETPNKHSGKTPQHRPTRLGSLLSDDYFNLCW